MTVTYEEISSAFEFVASGAPMEHSAYISLDTGTIYWASELASLDEELPDDLDTSDRYLVVPHKTELGLGKNLALRFAPKSSPTPMHRSQAFSGPRGPTGGSSSYWKTTAFSRTGTNSRRKLPTRLLESGARQMTHKSLRAMRRQRPNSAFENGRVRAPLRALCRAVQRGR